MYLVSWVRVEFRCQVVGQVDYDGMVLESLVLYLGYLDHVVMNWIPMWMGR